MTQKGFTLTEVIIASSVAVVISGLLLIIMVNSTGLFYQQSSRVSQGVSANDTLSTIRKLVKEAGSVAGQYPETGTPEYSSNQTSLVLKVPSIDISGAIISATSDYIIYYINNTKLYEKTIPNAQSARQLSEKVLSTRVETVIFEYLDINDNPVVANSASKVKVTLKISELVGGINRTHVATSEANLRND